MGFFGVLSGFYLDNFGVHLGSYQDSFGILIQDSLRFFWDLMEIFELDSQDSLGFFWGPFRIIWPLKFPSGFYLDNSGILLGFYFKILYGNF